METLGGILGIILIFGFLMYHFWQYILPLLVAIGAIKLIFYIQKETRIAKEAREAEERADLAEIERWHEREQREIDARKREKEQLKTQLIQICEDSLRWFEEAPKLIISAESLLNQAETDFKEGAYAPFWDSVEKAAMKLGEYNRRIVLISSNANLHGEVARKVPDVSLSFPISSSSVKALTAADYTTNRMAQIVRTAQRNFEFSTIYEQRRTNQILIAGFNSLSQALDGLGQQLTESINGLNDNIQDLSTSLSNAMDSIGAKIEEGNKVAELTSDSINKFHSTIILEAAEQRERHDRTLRMLNHIMRRRRPAGVDPLEDMTTVYVPND